MRSRSHCVLIPILNTQYPIPSSQFPIRIRKSIIQDADATGGHLWHSLVGAASQWPEIKTNPKTAGKVIVWLPAEKLPRQADTS